MSYNKEVRQGVFIGIRGLNSQQVAIFEIGAPDSS